MLTSGGLSDTFLLAGALTSGGKKSLTTLACTLSIIGIDIPILLRYLCLCMPNDLFRAFDPRLREVILHKSRYVNHIWPNHPVADVEYIRETIEDPDLITIDVNDDYIENYYRQAIIGEYPTLFLKVCVLFKIDDKGSVITAFAVDWPKLPEEVIWQK